MQDFDSLKNIWQQSATNREVVPLQPVTVAKNSATLKMKLQQQQLLGGVMLVVTAILLALLIGMGIFKFEHWYTYGAIVFVCMICIIQSVILFGTYKKIKAIDATSIPTIHLRQWEAYYHFRKKQIQWNMPVYYFFLNLAMGIYFIEVLGGRPLLNIGIFLVIYFAWMLFSWFYLGKKNLKKENNRLQQIIQDLKLIEQQLNTAE